MPSVLKIFLSVWEQMILKTIYKVNCNRNKFTEYLLVDFRYNKLFNRNFDTL